jgi:hypothetical protein
LRLAALTLASLSLATHALDPHQHGGHTRVVGHGQIRFDGAGPERWAQRWRAQHRLVTALRHRLRQQRRTLLSSPTVSEAINLAAATYGHSDELWRKARCETGGSFDPRSRNLSSAASGLFQFLGSTWRSTPYAGFSVFSPYANALAAGWMHAHGRGGEWACQ